MPTLAELEDPAAMDAFVKRVAETVAEMSWHPTHRHYEGGEYVRTGEATHTESGERLVIYADREGRTHASPYDMFYGAMEDGRRRFAPLAPEPERETDEERLEYVRRTGLMRDGKDMELWMASTPRPTEDEEREMSKAYAEVFGD